MSNQVETGYTATVRDEPSPQRSRVRVTCEHCGEAEVQIKYWCIWDESTQQWVTDELDEDSCGYYCKQCGTWWDGEDYQEEQI